MANDNAPRRAAQPTPPREAFNAADEQAIAERTKESKAREARRVEGLKKIVADVDTRLFLWDLLSTCGIYRTSFTGNSETFFREGARNVGLKIQADIMKHAPDSFVTMMKENQDAS